MKKDGRQKRGFGVVDVSLGAVLGIALLAGGIVTFRYIETTRDVADLQRTSVSFSSELTTLSRNQSLGYTLLQRYDQAGVGRIQPMEDGTFSQNFMSSSGITVWRWDDGVSVGAFGAPLDQTFKGLQCWEVAKVKAPGYHLDENSGVTNWESYEDLNDYLDRVMRQSDGNATRNSITQDGLGFAWSFMCGSSVDPSKVGMMDGLISGAEIGAGVDISNASDVTKNNTITATFSGLRKSVCERAIANKAQLGVNVADAECVSEDGDHTVRVTYAR